MARGKEIIIPVNPVSRFLFSNTSSAWIWLIVRLYLGYAWITAGWKKVTSPAWTGENAGVAIQGFVQGALEKEEVASWYAASLQNTVLPNATIFYFMVAYGEFKYQSLAFRISHLVSVSLEGRQLLWARSLGFAITGDTVAEEGYDE